MHDLRRFPIVTAAILVCLPAAAQLTDADKAEIQALSAQYLSSLGACDAVAYAELFAPATGYFASSFRGEMVGREQLIALVESERHCTAAPGTEAAIRRTGGDVPKAQISVTAEGVFGEVDLGFAQYQDEYVKTSAGWRFASRWVLNAEEIEAGLSAREEAAIVELSGADVGENWVPDENGVPRLLNAGVTLNLTDGRLTGRVFLPDGSYYDDVYEQLGPQRWRIASRTHVPASGN